VQAVVRPNGGHAVVLNWTMFTVYGVNKHEVCMVCKFLMFFCYEHFFFVSVLFLIYSLQHLFMSVNDIISLTLFS